MDGIIPLWKPKGLTSHDCVIKIRKLFKTNKVGHTGTLDPEAEGVLPICVGQATKIVPFLTDTKKTYIAEVSLGKATETEDATGEIVEQKAVLEKLDKDTINAVLHDFTGEITQIPPMYSAVKVNGKKLYEYARANKSVERPKRKITIYDLTLLEQLNNTTFKIKVICSKGTYIRTLCVDIGKKLGYPAHMASLIRTATGSINEGDTVTFDELEQAVSFNRISDVFLPMSKGLTHLESIQVDDIIMKRVRFGQKLLRETLNPTSERFLVMHNDKLLAIYQVHPENTEQLKPVRVFR